MKNVLINGSWNIILPDHRADRPEWTSPAGWEKARLQSIHDHVKKGDIFYYIGNEEGDMSALISMWGARLVLVEPNEKVWSNSKAIWEANDLQMPFACFVGFASHSTELKDGRIIYNRFPDCADGPIISDHGFKEFHHEAANWPQVKIDDLVEITGFVPNHISLDVEGSESFVLEGAAATIKKYRPTIWLSAHPEFMQAQFGQYLFDLRKWIRDFGYTETLLDYQHEVHLLYTK